MKQRDPFFDLLKGIAIIGVVAIHTFPGVESCFLEKILRLLMNISVPIFLMISGYFLGKKDLSTMDKYRLFEIKQISKVYFPMLLWSLPYLLYSIYMKDFSIKSLIVYFVGGYSIYYFIALIIQFYLFLPVIQKFNSKKIVYVSLIVNYVAIAVLYYLMTIKKIDFPLIAYAGPFPVWILSFVMGVYFSKYSFLISNKLLLFFLILSIVGMYLESVITGTYGILRFSWPIYCFSCLALLMQNKNRSYYNSKLVYIGDISFMIYLMHMYFIPISNKLYQYLGFTNWILSIITVLLLTVFFFRLLKFNCNAKYYKYIGC